MVAPTLPTVWGLSPAQLHDRYWASLGVQIVRQGQPSEIVEKAEMYLLTDPELLTLFELHEVTEILSWEKPELLYVRLQDRREQGYREFAECDDEGNFLRFRREYNGVDAKLRRVICTCDRQLARVWQQASSDRTAWRQLRELVAAHNRRALVVQGRIWDGRFDEQQNDFVRRLVQVWKRPDVTIRRAVETGPGVWADGQAALAPEARFIGSVWVGAGRRIQNDCIVGPAVLWDDPAARPSVETLVWDEIEPVLRQERLPRPRRQTSFERAVKRAFDVAFSTMVLLFTLPFYPLICLAIWLEDGRPFFFAHRRETCGPREFGCIKFRSMRKDAEQIKAKLLKENQADGPQFFMKHDPRLTTVGRFLRKWNIDELPQFINVLKGEMSVVGPRPSPHSENQYCPAWREARLSVRPGITGLWQVMRTREAGTDFQEWIKYDIEYVETFSLRLDLYILCRTFRVLLRGGGA